MEHLRAITSQHGVFLRREAVDLGVSDNSLLAAVRHGLLRRVRQGCYCFADEWSALDPRGRHLVLARAVLRSTPGKVVLSHTSALVAHGIEVWGADLSRVHVTRLDAGSGRARHDVVHHEGLASAEDVVTAAGLPALPPARAVLESASILSAEAGLVSADSALHQHLCSPDELYAVFEQLNHWRGSQKIHVVLHHMDGRSANAGETRSRHMMWRFGLPAPRVQYEVRDDAGFLVAILDFAWPEHRAFGEFDGRQKYVDYLRPGETPGDAVFREKRREDLVREITGWRGVRWTWLDLDHPIPTCARISSVLHWAA